MAILRRIGKSKNVILKSYHLIGRLREKCDLFINSFDCSRMHAVIEYNSKKWTLSDMSSNGTIVNGKLIQKKTVELKKGDLIEFSVSDQGKYEVIDLDEPCAYLIDNQYDEIIFISSTFLELEGIDSKLLIYKIANNQWMLEEGSKSKLLANNDEIKLRNGKNWFFGFDENLESTQSSKKEIKQLEFHFEVSPDYEHVSIDIKVDGEVLKLPKKTMNYTFYLLAKQINKDVISNTFSEKEKGWIPCENLINILQKELGNESIDIYYLNVQVHRIRKMFSKTAYGPILNELIERRKGQIRFKHPDIFIKEYGVAV